MPEIVTLLHSFAPYLKATTLRQMAKVMTAILTMSGRITMLGISRWTEKGGSYRTIQRLYNTGLPWAILHWAFFKAELHEPDDVHIMVGAEWLHLPFRPGQVGQWLTCFYSAGG